MDAQTIEATPWGRHTLKWFLLLGFLIVNTALAAGMLNIAPQYTTETVPTLYCVSTNGWCSQTADADPATVCQKLNALTIPGGTIMLFEAPLLCKSTNPRGYFDMSIQPDRQCPISNRYPSIAYYMDIWHYGRPLCVRSIPDVCPANASSNSIQCTCNSGYISNQIGNACVQECPAHANGAPCQCDSGYEWDAAHTSCVSTCPVPDLAPLPPDDLCAQSLEAGHGDDVNGACPQVSDALTKELQCFSNKIAATNALARPPIPYAGPTATIRNAAYQAHFQDVWDTWAKLENLSDPLQISACQTLRDKVASEIGCSSDGHCIDYPPADISNHSAGAAFDVSRKTIKGILRELTPLPPAPMTLPQLRQFEQAAISGWLASPTTCNLVWGGSFQKSDRVHFQLP